MQLLVGVVMPLIVLGILVAGSWVLLSRAQSANDFDISQIFREDVTGKVSMTQMLKLGAFVFSVLGMIIIIVTLPADAIAALVTFSGTWGPTAVALEFVKRKWPINGPEQQ